MTTSAALPVYQVLRSRRRTIALIVKPDGSVLVRAPLRAPKAMIEEFVGKNAQWIERKQTVARAALAPAPREYVTGESFPYLGRTHPLEIVQGQREPLLLKEETFKLAASRQGAAASTFERWYRERAREVLTERLEFFAHQHELQYRGIRITSARTRWGSCSASGSLSFSWRLILAPPEVVDYVVVHELMHTVFHNHSKRFWQAVGKVMPDYQEHRRWLREHGRELLV